MPQPATVPTSLTATLTLLAVLILSVTSCEALKPASGNTRDERRAEERRAGNDELDPVVSRRVYDPESGTYIYVENAPTDKMDTVQWTTVSEEAVPPIEQKEADVYVPPTTVPGRDPVRQIGSGNNGSRKLSGYNVTMALPFLTSRYFGSEDKVDANSLWSLHFYSGARMAFDEFERSRADSRFYVDVKDTDAAESRVARLVEQDDFRGAQMVIGPYVKANVAAMAEAVKQRETVLVSPFSAGTGVSAENANYVQVNPTLTTHLENILDHAMRNQNADRIVLVTSGSSAQKTRLAELQEIYRRFSNQANIDSLEQLTVDANSAESGLADYLTGAKTVFIVPVYEDEPFVANFLRQLYAATREDFGQSVAVYGLPQWMDFTRINFDYYEGTNVHVSSSVFIDMLDPAVRDFRRSFFDRYAALPRDEAYVGYDVTRYFLRMMMRYGTRFQYDLPSNPEDLLHTKFRFEPVVDYRREDSARENAPVDRWENKYVNILRFRDYTFRRVN